MQNRDQSGPCVFGVDIDRPRTKSAKRDFRSTEPGSPLDGHTARFKELCEHLAQQIRFAERLGPNDNRAPSADC
jgi:hypothetical protein